MRQTLFAAYLALGAISCQKVAPPEAGGASPGAEPSSYLGQPGLPVEITINDSDWQALRDPQRVEEYREQPHEFTIRMAGGRQLPATYRIRGETSLRRAFQIGQPERLNFTVDLHQKLPFRPGIALRRFYLQNMIYDRNHFKMRFSYRLLEELGLFPSHNQLVSLSINGLPLGLYLLLERPKDAILRTRTDVSSIYRRSYTEAGQRGLYQVVFERNPAAGEPHIERLRWVVANQRGEQLVADLEQIIDLDAYLRWLAFNSVTRNSDSYDELFLYVVRSPRFPDGRLELMAWDYDDIMRRQPAHPRLALKDPLLFACEAPLDRRIQQEALLYGRFRQILRDLLTELLTPTRLDSTIQETLLEIEAIPSELPDNEATRIERRERLEIFRQALMARRGELLDRLATDIS